jgi:hypothetical protein
MLAGFLAELLEEGIIVWAWPPFSLAPLVTTFYPNVTLTQCIYAFVGCTVVGLIAAVIPWRLRPSRHEPVSLAPDSNQRPPDMRRSGGARSCGTAASCGAPHARRRPSARRSPSRARSAFSFSVGYFIFAIVIVALKLVQVATAH